MDTIEIMFRDSELYNAVQNRLLEHGQITGIKRNDLRSFFRHRLSAEYNVKSIALFSKPRMASVEPYKLQVHLSQFDSYWEFLEWFEELAGDKAKELQFGRISRLDVCIDLPLLFGDLASRIRAARVRSERVISSKSQSIILGRGDRSTIIYEKEYERDQFDIETNDLRTSGNYAQGVRIEVRLRSHKIPIKYIYELHKLNDYFPFDHLDLVQVRDFSHSTQNQLNGAYAVLFDLLSKQIGVNAAERQLGITKNRSKYLEFEPSKELLKLAWKNRLERFFAEPIVEPTPFWEPK